METLRSKTIFLQFLPISVHQTKSVFHRAWSFWEAHCSVCTASQGGRKEIGTESKYFWQMPSANDIFLYVNCQFKPPSMSICNRQKYLILDGNESVLSIFLSKSSNYLNTLQVLTRISYSSNPYILDWLKLSCSSKWNESVFVYFFHFIIYLFIYFIISFHKES